MAKQQLFCPQGTDFSTSVTLTADDGTAINVAGYVFGSAIRKNVYSDNASAQFVITTPDAPNGNVQIALTAANSANLEQGSYLYTVQMCSTANITSVLLDGIFNVIPNVILQQPTPSTV